MRSAGSSSAAARKKPLPPPPPAAPDITAPPAEPHVGDEAETPRDEPRRTIEEVDLPDGSAPPGRRRSPQPPSPKPAAEIEVPEPTAGRLVRLRARLSRSQNALGKGLLTLLSREHLDEDTWEEIEDTLLTADVGVQPTQELVERLRERVKVLGTRTPDELRGAAARGAAQAGRHRLRPRGEDRARGRDTPGIVMVVGVNGTGKTTTTGKLARVLVADGRSVVLGAADTFRAAAADQLQTWGERVGAHTVRGPEGGDPASVAFDAVKEGNADGRRRGPHRHRRPAAHQDRPHGRARQGQARRREARPARRGAARPRRHHRAERPGPGPGLRRGRRHHRHRADQARRHRQGRHRDRRPARAGRPGQARRARRGRGRPGAVRAGGVRRRPDRRVSRRTRAVAGDEEAPAPQVQSRDGRFAVYACWARRYARDRCATYASVPSSSRAAGGFVAESRAGGRSQRDRAEAAAVGGRGRDVRAGAQAVQVEGGGSSQPMR